MKNQIKEMVQKADLVLIGIGEEFEGIRYLKSLPAYNECREKAERMGQEWLIPLLNRYFADSIDVFQVKAALSNLARLLQDKNYFVVCEATNDYIWEAGLKEDRIVAPCGGSRKKQCAEGGNCSYAPVPVAREEKNSMINCIETGLQGKISLSGCRMCNSPMILNNIYTEKYDERGYLEQWQKYTTWLQGTLNKKLCILELGVGMQCPGVIRFPFEKIGYFNRKADFVRVNKNLYQMTEELKEKGISISENAVDWLTSVW